MSRKRPSRLKPPGAAAPSANCPSRTTSSRSQVQTHVLQQYAPGRAVGHGRRAREPEGQDHAVLAQITAQDRA